MAFLTDTPRPHALAALRTGWDNTRAGLRDGFRAWVESRSRMAEIARLNAKSDAELLAMGLKREDIPRHVFRDLFGF